MFKQRSGAFRGRDRLVSQASSFRCEALESRQLLAADPVDATEFRVNSTTSGDQVNPTTAADAQGNFVVVWNGNGVGDADGVFLQRFDSTGTRVGQETLVNTSTTGQQLRPAVAMNAAGQFVVAWVDFGDASTPLHAQRFGSGGNRLGSEIKLAALSSIPTVAIAPDGSFAIAYLAVVADNVAMFVQRYNSSAAVGLPLRVSEGADSGGASDPRIAFDSSGGFAVAWRLGSLVYARSYTSDGMARTAPILANTPSSESVTFSFPDVITRPGGGFVITWDQSLSLNNAPNYDTQTEPYFRMFDAAGVAAGPAARVNGAVSPNLNSATTPFLARDADGDFAILCRSSNQDGSSLGVYARRFDSSGVPTGSDWHVNTVTAGAQFPGLRCIAMDADGDMVIVWTSDLQDGSGRGVYARRYKGRYATIEPVDENGNVIANNSAVPEGGVARFRITRSDLFDGQERRFQIRPSGSAEPDDYANAFVGTEVKIEAGQESVIVPVPITGGQGPTPATQGDGKIEENSLENETLSFTLVPLNTGVVVKDGTSATVTYQLVDMDGVVVGMRTNEKDGSAVESAIVPDSAGFKLRRTGDVSLPLIVDVDVSGTAELNTAPANTTPNGDYTVSVESGQGSFTRSGSTYRFTFNPNVSAMDVLINPVDDATSEGVEWVHAEVLGGTGYQLTVNPEWISNRVGIIDNEVDSVRAEGVAVSMTEAGQVEGRVDFTRRGIGTTARSLNIDFELRGTFASTDFDVLATDGTPLAPTAAGIYRLILPAGQETVAVRLLPRNDDVPERDKLVQVALVASSEYVPHSTLNLVELRLNDDDRPIVTLLAEDAFAAEPGDAGTFLLRRTGGASLASPLSVTLRLDGTSTAIRGQDYTIDDLDVTFPSHVDVVRVNVVPRADTRVEPAETVAVRLLPMATFDVSSDPVQQTAVVTIADYQTGRLRASFTWWMPDRYGVDRDAPGEVGYGLTDLPNRKWYVDGYDDANLSGGSGYAVTLDATGSAAPVNASYLWSLRHPDGTIITASGRQTTVKLKDDTTYHVTLTVDDGTGAQTQTQYVHVNDILILGMGDSMASGEGNPEVRTNNAPLQYPLATATWADGTDPEMDAWNKAAHRSTKSAFSLVAKGVEDADRKSSVTFVHVAESGAEVLDGLVQYDAVNPLPGKDGQPQNPTPQLAYAKQVISDRKIDALLLSIGINDIGFSDLVTAYTLRTKVQLKFKALWGLVPLGEKDLFATKSLDSIADDLHKRLVELPARYALLSQKLNETFGANGVAGNVYLMGYPESYRDVAGNISGGAMRDTFESVLNSSLGTLSNKLLTSAVEWITRLSLPALGGFSTSLGIELPLEIDQEEAQHAMRYAAGPLHDAQVSAAAQYGWHFVEPTDAWLTKGYPAAIQKQPSYFRTVSEARRFQGGVGPFGWLSGGDGAHHPNEAGHEALADGVKRTLGQLGRSPTPPTVSLPESVGVIEGGLTTIAATATGDGLTYAWDLEYDGSEFRATPGQTGTSVFFSAGQLSYPHARQVAVQVTNSYGQAALAVTDLRVLNGAGGRFTFEVPSVSAGEPFRLPLRRVRGAYDPVNHWRVDWGDGSDPDADGQVGERVPGDWATRSHVYANPGQYTYRVWLTDAGGETEVEGGALTVVKDDPFPRVSVQSIDNVASEQDPAANLATFRFTRAGQPNASVSISLDWRTGGGRAVNGVDYTTASGAPLPVSLTFAPHQDTIDLLVRALRDADEAEGTEFADVVINPSSLYAVTHAPPAVPGDPSYYQARALVEDGPSTTRGSIRGKVFDDRDGSGTRGASESAISGRMVLLDLDGDGEADAGEPTATTDGQGGYAFSGLLPMGYHVVLLPQAGWLATTSASRDVTVGSGEAADGADFGVARPVTLAGRVYDDADIDGAYTAGEAPRGGVVVFVDGDDDGTLDASEPSTVTLSDGTYQLSDVAPGTLRVRQVAPAGWADTSGGARAVTAAGGDSVGGLDLTQRRALPQLTSVALAPALDNQRSGSALASGTLVTLAADGVDPWAASVRFYRESNGVTGLQAGSPGGDTLIGEDLSSADGWNWTFRAALAAGDHAFYASASDGDGLAGGSQTVTCVVAGDPGTTTVGVRALTPFVREGGTLALSFDVFRTGDNSLAVEVPLVRVADTAGLTIPPNVTIPAGQDSLLVQVPVPEDGVSGPARHPTLAIGVGAGYVVSSEQSSAQVTVRDGSGVAGVLSVLSAQFRQADPVDVIEVTLDGNPPTSLSADAVRLHNETTGQDVPASELALSVDYTRGVLRIGAPGLGGNGKLPAGDYRLTLSAAAMTDEAGHPLDGNDNGIGGDDLVMNFTVPGALPAWVTPDSVASWDGNTLTVSGATSIIADPNPTSASSGSPAITANGAAAIVTLAPSAGSVVHLGTVTLGGGASLVLPAHGAGAAVRATVLTGTLGIDAASRLDLADNVLVLKGGDAAAGATMRTLLAAGFNGGRWDGVGGITSSAAAGDPVHATSVGYAANAALNATSFAGVTGLTGGDVLVRFTYAGDANLDGKVDIGDLGLLSGAWQQPSGKSWFDGDFTYDGAVNIGDLGLLSGNWQKGIEDPL